MKETTVVRTTKETIIRLRLGAAEARISTSVPMLTHFLDQLNFYGDLGLDLEAEDLMPLGDGHHLAEDVAITLGRALDQALGDRKGLTRYGQRLLPMDEALATCALDLGGRPYAVLDLPLPSPMLGGLATEHVAHFFCRLAFGARIVFVADVVPEQLLDTLEQEGVTNTFLVPAVLQSLVAVPGAAERDWSRLRAIAYGASPITSTALRGVLDTFGVPLFQVYGSTETAGAITQLEPEDHDPEGPRAHLMRPAGRPYPWVEVRIADPENGEDPGAARVG